LLLPRFLQEKIDEKLTPDYLIPAVMAKALGRVFADQKAPVINALDGANLIHAYIAFHRT
jgi:hypothetical protein